MKKFLIAAAVVCIGLSNPCAGWCAKKAAKSKAAAAAKKPSPVAAVPAVSPSASLELVYTGQESKRDPFGVPAIIEDIFKKPDQVKGLKLDVVKLPNVKIEGLILSKTMPQAIIDGAVKKVGDFIEDFEIKEITEQGIILFLKGREYTLRPSSDSSSATGGKARPKKR
ncbi:MAG: general secretion pathway protein GspB [Candidatus Omnitrophica bacterium]|nr:general secretion pathway protein GspB [Candidatus Omnitrophota bacterium]